MNPVRTVLLGIGIAIVIVGIYLMYFESGLDRWISVGVVTAGVLILIGLLVLGFAGGARLDRPVATSEREVHHYERPREPVRETRSSESLHEPGERKVESHYERREE